MPATVQKAWVQVWDPLVRYAHWALVVAFAAAWLSADDDSGGPDQLHVWAGYATGFIVAVRIAWGLVGAGHARFRDFVTGPITALTYLADLLRGTARRYLSHSPIGGAMVVALLLCLSGTVWTGLVAYGDSGKGPLASAGRLVIPEAHAEDHKGGAERASGRGRDGESAVGELHGTLANIMLGLVILHILGVGLASLVHRENLVSAMFNGLKRPEDER